MRRQNPTLRLIIAALLPFLLAACAGELKQPSPIKRYYVFSVERPTRSTDQTTTQGKVLGVRRLSISPAFSSREFAYLSGENVFVQDYYNLFLASPADLLTQTARRWMADSGLFSMIAGPGSDLRPDYLLEGNCVSLYGDFSDKSQPKAVLEISFFLVKDDSLQYDVIMSRDYRRETTISDPTPQGLAAGFNQALTEILTTLEQDARTALEP